MNSMPDGPGRISGSLVNTAILIADRLNGSHRYHHGRRTAVRQYNLPYVLAPTAVVFSCIGTSACLSSITVDHSGMMSRWDRRYVGKLIVFCMEDFRRVYRICRTPYSYLQD